MRGTPLVLLLFAAQLALLVFFIVMLLRMTRAQERIAVAMEQIAARRDPGAGPGPTVAGS